jgi:NAD-dependent deacetylase
MSTECGISDYRSQGGLWQKYQPVTFQEFLEDEDKRKEYWARKKEMFGTIRAALPGPGHLAMARFETSPHFLGLITQNIDGLHARAGSKKILELHGTNLETLCLGCEKTEDFEIVYARLLRGEEAPRCLACGGLLKPNTISFGQELDARTLYTAFDWAAQCDLMICAGSSLVVQPAASLPRRAKEAGAGLVLINREPTPLDPLADLAVHTDLGPFLNAGLP